MCIIMCSKGSPDTSCIKNMMKIKRWLRGTQDTEQNSAGEVVKVPTCPQRANMQLKKETANHVVSLTHMCSRGWHIKSPL